MMCVVALSLWLTVTGAPLQRDPACMTMIRELHQFAELITAEPATDGASYRRLWRIVETGTVVEIRHPLAPPAQWEDPKVPESLDAEPPLSIWIDHDADRLFEDLWVRTDEISFCKLVKHYHWNVKAEEYQLVVSPKERA